MTFLVNVKNSGKESWGKGALEAAVRRCEFYEIFMNTFFRIWVHGLESLHQKIKLQQRKPLT